MPQTRGKEFIPCASLTRPLSIADDAAMALALDTLAYARRLREAGFSEQQAEGQAGALAAAMTDSLATKQDVQALSARMDAFDVRMDMLATRQELRELEHRMELRFERVDARFAHVVARIDNMERHLDLRLDELEKRFDGRLDLRLSDLERRMTMRLGGLMVTGIAILAALVKLP